LATDTGAAGSGEAECEDVSDDGCSVAGTEYSVGGASEAAAEQMYVTIEGFHFPHLSSLPSFF